ncbi:sporulation protein YtxC [Alicyclobacillus herbarius]|uniref:sporulation protein YtxC n=1 Tax=Alicyclobacillus herbarius TaxID=122960 RepID=UPI0004034487|nr:sporulation protein YtxC [Alicyclobacillus herbarius]
MRSVRIEVELAKQALYRRLGDAGCDIRCAEDGSCVWTFGADENLLSVLLAFILSDWQYEYIQQRLSMTHPELTSDQREYIGLLTMHCARGPRHFEALDTQATMTSPAEHPYAEFVARIRGALEELVPEEMLNIEGLVRFRGRSYLMWLHGVLEELVEQVLTDQEYEEFVAMLRYVLDVQPLSEQRLHVFCTDERVWICDDSGELVRDREVSLAAELACPGEDVNAEDLAMSILITRSPQEIVIHDLSVNAPWPSFAETVERVFVERAVRCGGCPTCRRLRESGGVAPL